MIVIIQCNLAAETEVYLASTYDTKGSYFFSNTERYQMEEKMEEREHCQTDIGIEGKV